MGNPLGDRRRDRIVRYRADPALARETAAARISAYVYGNILVFASVATMTAEDVAHFHGVLLVLGVTASTYLAHMFAELVGRNVRTDAPLTRAELWHELRDSVPIISSAIVPALLLAAAALESLSASAAIVASEVYLFVRIALFGLLVERLRATRASARTLLVGLLTAAAAAGISLLKVAVGH
ncbi:hypothetical protein [Catenuloplanes japonicus]|uniref:hypothetical protein n=1 Tax=Catenuloplanes japonicus TaxID=33876 RepID=UPI0005267715|nr:hypothetical protein [Catenuloplanes japonicus]